MSLNPGDFEYIRKLVYDSSAILLEPGKEYLVESRLGILAREKGLASVGEVVGKLRVETRGVLKKDVIDAMTTNETSFFRDIHPFEAIKKSLLPALQAKRSLTRKIRIWCGACSSGQEPYSLAILIREHFPMLNHWDFGITASDLSETMLAKARLGSYGSLEINRGLPAPLMVKYFVKQGIGWQVRQDIRDMIDFRQINLKVHWPPMPAMDIIMLRNVMIYFDQDTKRSILSQIRRTLKPDGYLFLGSAETTFNLDDSFERVMFDRAVVYRLKTG